MQVNYVNKILAFLFIFLPWFCGCEDSDVMDANQGAFISIYDNQQLDEEFYPLDILELPEGGFLILSAFIGDTVSYAWPGIHLMQVDASGSFVWEAYVDDTYVSPVSGLLEIEGRIFVTCMDRVTLHATILEVSGEGVQLHKRFDDIIYPLLIRKIQDGGILLLSYDRVGRESKLTRLTLNFSEDWEAEFPVIDDAEEQIISHLTRKGTQYPFLAGTAGINEKPFYYYVNAFSNYTLSTIFINSTGGDRTGILNGFQYTAAVSALEPVSDTSYAMAIFNAGDNYLFPNISIPVDKTLSIKDYEGTRFQELQSNAKVKVHRVTFNSKDFVVFASQSKNNRLMVYVFDPLTQTLVDAKSFGSNDPVEVSSFIQTMDGGLAILSQTWVAGRFPRVQLFRIPAEEFNY